MANAVSPQCDSGGGGVLRRVMLVAFCASAARIMFAVGAAVRG